MLKFKINYNISVFYLLGVFSTCACVALVAKGHVISFYTITLVISFIVLIRGKKKNVNISNNRSSKLFFYWTIWGLLSSAFGIIFFINENNWIVTIVSGIVKIVLYFFFFSLLIKNINGLKYSQAILKGLICGIIINTMWASADAIIFYVSGISITNEIFKPFIIATNVRYQMLSLVVGQGFIRCAGLNGDPANIGMFAPILASYSLYSKRHWLYIFVVLSIFSSVSIVGLVSTLIITFLYFLKNIKVLLTSLLFSLFIIAVGINFLKSNNQTVEEIQMVEAVTSRLENKTDSDDESTKTRSIYWFKFIPAVINSPTSFLIGTGYNTSSHAYLKSGYIKGPNEPFDPEQTYFSFYFDLGLIGFLVFLCLHFHILRVSSRNKDKEDFLMLFAGMEGIMISFMGYHYTLYSVPMLFLIAGIVTLYNINSYNNSTIINKL